MPHRIDRRAFLGRSAAVGAGLLVASRGRRGRAAASDRLNVGIIGVANRGGDNLAGVGSQNIAALCDIDDNYLRAAAERFPGARTYHDFRKLLEQADLDAVVVSTADHVHAPAAAAALRAGKHVYCEKPLAHSVHEARTLARLANETGLATQMGTQIHAGDNYRRVVELVQSGAIGPVREIHVWCGKNWGGGERPTEMPPVPPHLNWDLWLGPAPERPYHGVYLPANWRRWWDFGNGTLGDMGCHYMDLPFWALDLRYPTRVEAEGPPLHSETAPEWLVVRFDFPARGEQPPLKFTWYDGGQRPALFAEGKLPEWGDGTLFVGDKGMLLADYGNRLLLPEEDFRDFQPPAPTIPSSIGHHEEWIAACKGNSRPLCQFDYSGPLTEAVLLGNVAYRAGQPLEWDAEALTAVNCPTAAPLVQREYRAGWTL